MRSIYVHCGLHKTGTTSLQKFLSHNDEELRLKGFLYPLAGRKKGDEGHHNIAWELSRDRRYDPAHGTINDLLKEIESFDGDAILSSEVFESLIDYPEKWSRLINSFNSLGCSVTFVVYLRNQFEYFESLFFQLLKDSYGGDYLTFANQVIQTRKFIFNEEEFHFDFINLLNKIAEIPDTKVVARNFHYLLDQSTISDFCSVVGVKGAFVNDSTHIAENIKLSLEKSFALFYKNRKLKKIRLSDKVVLSSVADFLKIPSHGSSKLREEFKNIFFEDNKQIEDRFLLGGLNEDFIHNDNLINHAIQTIDREKLFSYESFRYLRNVTLDMHDPAYFMRFMFDFMAGKPLDRELKKWADWIVCKDLSGL